MSKEYIISESHTLGNLIRYKLVQDDHFAAYKTIHPTDRNVKLRIIDDCPDELFQQTIEELLDQTSRFKKAFETACEK